MTKFFQNSECMGFSIIQVNQFDSLWLGFQNLPRGNSTGVHMWIPMVQTGHIRIHTSFHVTGLTRPSPTLRTSHVLMARKSIRSIPSIPSLCICIGTLGPAQSTHSSGPRDIVQAELSLFSPFSLVVNPNCAGIQSEEGRSPSYIVLCCWKSIRDLGPSSIFRFAFEIFFQVFLSFLPFNLRSWLPFAPVPRHKSSTIPCLVHPGRVTVWIIHLLQGAACSTVWVIHLLQGAATTCCCYMFTFLCPPSHGARWRWGCQEEEMDNSKEEESPWEGERKGGREESKDLE